LIRIFGDLVGQPVGYILHYWRGRRVLERRLNIHVKRLAVSAARIKIRHHQRIKRNRNIRSRGDRFGKISHKWNTSGVRHAQCGPDQTTQSAVNKPISGRAFGGTAGA